MTVRQTPQQRNKFKSTCEVLSVTHKELILDVVTRWSSTMTMLDQAVEMRQVSVIVVVRVKSRFLVETIFNHCTQ